MIPDLSCCLPTLISDLTTGEVWIISADTPTNPFSTSEAVTYTVRLNVPASAVEQLSGASVRMLFGDVEGAYYRFAIASPANLAVLKVGYFCILDYGAQRLTGQLERVDVQPTGVTQLYLATAKLVPKGAVDLAV